MEIRPCFGKGFSDRDAISDSSIFKDLKYFGNIVVLDLDNARFGSLFSFTRLSLFSEHHLIAIIAR